MPCDQKTSQSFDVFAIANGAGPALQSVEVMVGLAEPWCFDTVLCVRRPNRRRHGASINLINERKRMEVVLDAVVLVGHAIEAALVYVESHHWIFGLLALGYIFYLHDRALHARFDALEKRVDEVRKRLAIEY